MPLFVALAKVAQLYMDDLPIWGMVGELTTTDMDEGGELEGEALVYTHKRFSVSYNEDRIIQARG